MAMQRDRYSQQVQYCKNETGSEKKKLKQIPCLYNEKGNTCLKMLELPILYSKANTLVLKNNFYVFFIFFFFCQLGGLFTNILQG